MYFPGGRPAPGLCPRSGVKQSLRRFRFRSAHPWPSHSHPARRKTAPWPHRSWPVPRPVRACPATQTDSAPLSIKPFERSAPLPQFQRRQRKQRKNQRSDPEAHDHFRFAPTKQFEMMMDGRHAEDALAAQLERAYLQNHGEGFQHKYAANKKQENLLLDDDCDHTERPAERKRTHISHEDFRGVRVVPEKAERRTDECATEYRELADLRDVLNVKVNCPARVAADVCQHGKGACSDYRAADGKTIQPVSQVDGVR